MSNVDREIEEALKDLCDTKYQIGYGDGLKKGRESGYTEGLETAWKAARMIVRTSNTDARMNAIFDDDFYYNQYSLLDKFSAAEAVAKIKQYENQHSEIIQEETFEVGDIVERTSAGTHFKAVIVNVELTPKGNTYITLMFSDGSSDKEKLGEIPWTKTREHVDLSNMLNMLSTEEN